MRKISLTELCRMDYNVRFLDYIEIPQRTTSPEFCCISYPKKQCLLLYLNDCETEYTTKDGQKISTHSGDVVYVPTGSEYSVKCIRARSAASSTFQINFLLFDSENQPFIISDQIDVFSPITADLKSLFLRQSLLSKNPFTFPSAHKLVMLELINALAGERRIHMLHPTIEMGLKYLHDHYDKDPSVEELAEICHISQVHFRKLFKEQTGKTPLEYKNMLRLRDAEQQMVYSDLPIGEIADRLGYATVAHFIKQFCKAYTVSPLAYRKRYRK